MSTFRRVSPGESRGTSPAFRAGWVNAVSEAAEGYHQHKAAGDADAISDAPTSSSGIIKVRNDTGQNLRRGHCVQLGAYIINKVDASNPLNKVDHRNPWFAGNLYDESEKERIAIVTRAMPNVTGESATQRIVPARIIGVCTALVNVTDTSHRFAKPVDGEIVLDSATSGPVEILSDLSETGEQEVAVLLGGGGGGGSDLQEARVTTAITGPSSNLSEDWGEGEVKLLDPSTGEEAADPITVKNPIPGHSFPVDAWVEVDTSVSPPKVRNGTCDALVDFWAGGS